MRIAEDIEVAIDLLLQNFVATKSAAFCVALQPIALCGITIYLLFLGFNIARGKLIGRLADAIWDLWRIGVIAEIALNVGAYQLTIVEGLDSIGGAVLETFAGVSSFGAILDNMAQPFDDLGHKFWNEATTGILPHVGLLFAAAVVSLVESVLFSVGLGFYLLAKVSVALTMAVGPGFILCAIWPSTAKYAENWLGQTLNYVFLKVFVGITVVMLISFASQFAEHILVEVDSVNIIQSACALLLSSIALAIVMLFLPSLSSALFGGASISGVGRAVAQLALHYLLKHNFNNPSNRPGFIRPIPNSSASQNSIGNATPLFQRNTLENLRTAR